MRRLDDLQNGYKLIQETNDFCFGTDAVLLADFSDIRKTDTVVDFCCGNGIIPILLHAKYFPAHITGVEIQPSAAALANENIAVNFLEDRIDIICGDIKNASKLIDKKVSAVTCNPPYMKWGGALVSREESKIIARHEIMCCLEDIFSSAAKILNFGGRLYMIHKADRTAEIIIAAAQFSFSLKRMRFVHSSSKKEAKLALFMFTLGGGSQSVIMPPIIINRTNISTKTNK